MGYKILIVDDHSVVRMGVEILLKDNFNDLEIFEADTFTKCLEYVFEENFDLVILDVNLPDGKKTMMIKELRNIFESLKILIFTAHEETDFAAKYIKVGANGFISKYSDEFEFINTVKKILNDEDCISNEVKYILKNQEVFVLEQKLSRREFEVAKLMVSGCGNLEISNQLNLKMSTISTYKNRIFEKLNISNTLELASIFSEY